LDELSKFRWQAGGVLAVFFLGPTLFNGFIPKPTAPQQVIIERTK
jgi:hypothetical protein